MKLLARRSIGGTISALVFALTLVIVGLFTLHFARLLHANARAALERKTATYGRILARELEPAVAFGDAVTAREAFNAVMVDDDVLGLALFDESGHLIESAGQPIDPRDASIAETSVVSKEGPRGTLRIQMSTAQVFAEQRRIVAGAIVLGLAALAATLVGARLIGRSIAVRLQRLAAQTASVTRGNLDVAIVTETGSDEISELTRTFAAMVERIRALVADMDSRVADRTSELDARNRAMRMVLDNVGDAIFTVDAGGNIGPERSRPADVLLGAPTKDTNVRTWLEAIDARAAAWLELGLAEVWEGVLPIELALDQLPKIMTNGRRHFAFHYTPIRVNSELVSVLVVVSDVTSEVEHRRTEGVQRDVLVALKHAVDDRPGFEDLATEVRKLLAVVTEPSSGLQDVKRALHTMKGTFATFRLEALGSKAHELETLVVDRERLPSDDDVRALTNAWELVDNATASVLAPMRNRTAVADAVLVSLAHDAQCAGAGDLAARIRELRGQTVHTRLGRLADHARAVATRLGKPDLEVTCTCDDTRLPPDAWLPFWSALVHTVRNAVDHGIELPEARERSGKSPRGKLTLRAESTRHRYIVEVTDDGRGIDWDQVKESATKLGVDAVTQQELEEVLFLEGVTTRDTATDISGRGLGMNATRLACEALDGRVSVTSTLGRGTTIRFEFPPADVSSHSAQAA